MQLQTASKQRAKIKMALQGPSGSGKTYSALLLAYGITNNWSTIAVIDTENHSAHLYAHLGKYNVLNLSAPFTPEKYIQAIQHCEAAGMEVIIIDSISHEWESIVEIHAAMAGNSFTNWSKLTPRHHQFLQTLLQSQAHIIATIRSKQDYILQEKNGKQAPQKVGLKGITREGMDYEFTIVLDLDIKHYATASKDRTQLFADQAAFIITHDTGKRIWEWCLESDGTPFEVSDAPSIEKEISACKTMNQLINLYGRCSDIIQTDYREQFAARKNELLSIHPQIKTNVNGTHHPTP